MKITPQQKILSVLQLIEEIRQLSAKGKPIIIEENDLTEREIIPEDFSRIIDKLVAEKLISTDVHQEIQLDGRVTYQYEIQIADEQAFKSYATKIHMDVHSDFDYLQPEKFLAVAEVLYDIYGQLQVSQESTATILIAPYIPRFPLLMPISTAPLRDRYGDFRMEAVKYMEDRNGILDYEIIRADHRWDSQVSVKVDRIAFQIFYDRFRPVFERRFDDTVQPTDSQDQQRTNNSPTGSESVKESLKGKVISFDAEKAKLCIGDKECQLPPYKNEHYLCKIMFQHPVDEPVEWQDVYDAMARSIEKYSEKVKDTKENRRPVYDAMLAVNGRVKELLNTDDDFLRWQEKTVIRKF